MSDTSTMLIDSADAPSGEQPVTTGDSPEPTMLDSAIIKTEGAPDSAPEVIPEPDLLGQDSGITEDDIKSILEKSIPDTPSFKDGADAVDVPSKDGEQSQGAKDEDILQELAGLSDLLNDENTLLKQEKSQDTETIQTLTTEKEQYKTLAESVDSLFNDIAKEIPFLNDIALAKGKGEEYEIPLHVKPENWEKVSSHPIVGPLVEGLLRGESIEPAAFVKALADSRRANSPSLTGTKPTVNVEREKKASDGLLGNSKSVTIK